MVPVSCYVIVDGLLPAFFSFLIIIRSTSKNPLASDTTIDDGCQGTQWAMPVLTSQPERAMASVKEDHLLSDVVQTRSRREG